MATRGRPVIVCPAAVSTTDAVTNTVIASVDVSTIAPAVGDCAIYAVGRFTGRNTSNGDSVGVTIAQTLKYVSGVLTLDGLIATPSAIQGVAALLLSVPTVAVTGTTVQAKMVGIAGVTISWTCWLELYVNGA